jgi:hypothetical protein
MVSEHVSEAYGSKIPVHFEYNANVRKGKGSITVIMCQIKTRGGNADREYEAGAGGEQFRARPALMSSRYLVSCWAAPPEDQALLGAVIRTFLDHPVLEFGSIEEEECIGYSGVPTITPESIELSEHKALADSYGMPIAPSFTYWVDYRVQSGITTPIKRVLERVTDFRKIEG